MSGKVKLDRWKPHLDEARRLGLSVAQYAREHGVSSGTLYAARQMLLRSERERKRRSVVAATPFIAVRISEPAPRPVPVRAQLVNGVVMEMLVDGDSALALGALVSALGALPCSG